MTNTAHGPRRSGGLARRRWARSSLAGAVIVAVVAAFQSPWLRPVEDRPANSTPVRHPTVAATPEAPEEIPTAPRNDVALRETPTAPKATEPQSTQAADSQQPPARVATRVVAGMVIHDQSGRVAYRGDVDLAPTLDRIAAGRRAEHRNDGSTFQNREGRLPKQPAGYYTEYVHPTPGLSGPGPQRIVVGRKGEVFYTPDHYRTFRRIR